MVSQELGDLGFLAVELGWFACESAAVAPASFWLMNGRSAPCSSIAAHTRSLAVAQ